MSASSPLVAGRYRLGESLGVGGMGRVWRAWDETLGREVAVKEIILPAELMADERDAVRRRTLREARAAARLTHHNVVRVYDVIEADERPWIVMEYVPSRSLHDVIRADGPLDPERVAEIGLGVLAALRAAHRAGVQHRDIKPGNVLLAEDDRVVLTDFGIATVEGDTAVTRPGLVLGSPAYIAPERARNGVTGPASDLWSLGATLYTAVEGHSPYERPSAVETLTALASAEPDPPQRAGVLEPVLTGLLRKRPEDRIGMDETERRLRVAAAGGPASGRRRWPWSTGWWDRSPAAVPSGAADAAADPADPADPADVGNRSGGVPTAPVDAIVPAQRAVGRASAPVVAGAALLGQQTPASADATELQQTPAAADATERHEPVAAPPEVGSHGEAVDSNGEAARAEAATGPEAATRSEPVSAPRVGSPDEAAVPGAVAPEGRAPAAVGVAAVPAGRATGFGSGLRGLDGRQRRVLASTLAVLALVIAAVVWVGTRDRPAGSDGVAKDRAAGGAVTATPAGTAGATQAPTATPDASSGVSGAGGAATSDPASAPAPANVAPGQGPAGGQRPALPAGWQEYRDPTGFSLYVPSGWTRSAPARGETIVYFRHAPTGRILGIDQTNRPEPDPVADWRSQSAYRVGRGDFPGYVERHIVAVPYSWQPAADWEFTYVRGGVRRHVNNRGFVVSPTRAYGIYWETTDAQWEAALPELQLVFQSFRPA
ncbi:MAG TPA: protein kinase [Micromonosporaceae bacterium]|nr:protein kinase [Micromonosporaceae bacterium]